VYSGDIVAFEEPEAALAGADLYVGDGSTLTESLVRRHPSGTLIGHTTVRAQLGWLARHGVLRAVFSHFGAGPIEMGETALREALEKLAAANPPGCAVTAAHDGLELEIGR
jgi:ribonuclease BN (tRNA processing enzyme)